MRARQWAGGGGGWLGVRLLSGCWRQPRLLNLQLFGATARCCLKLTLLLLLLPLPSPWQVYLCLVEGCSRKFCTVEERKQHLQVGGSVCAWVGGWVVEAEGGDRECVLHGGGAEAAAAGVCAGAWCGACWWLGLGP